MKQNLTVRVTNMEYEDTEALMLLTQFSSAVVTIFSGAIFGNISYSEPWKATLK